MDKQFVEIPVNLTEAGDDLVLHAAMPGTEPENILITSTHDTITLHSTMRGMLGRNQTPLMQEWHIGEYHRVVPLPYPINSQRVNATYNNGVLTLSMPKGEQTTPRTIKVKKVRGARGQTRGHSGRNGDR